MWFDEWLNKDPGRCNGNEGKIDVVLNLEATISLKLINEDISLDKEFSSEIATREKNHDSNFADVYISSPLWGASM